MIDWQRICLNLQAKYKPLAKVATEIGADAATLRRLARGETKEPKFSTGLRLLDLHYDQCSDRHTREALIAPEQRGLWARAYIAKRQQHANG